MNNGEELIKKVSSEEYKCPECGASMQYNPTTKSLNCDYCGSNIVIHETISNVEFDFDDTLEVDFSWQQQTHIIRCKGCGAENVISKKEISSICPFCGSKQVVELDDIAGVKPNRVIPFKIDQNNAVENYKKYIKGKLFVPSYVKKMNLELVINGVYIPVWTYDTNTKSSYRGRLGKHYTVTVGSGKNRRTVTRTRWFFVSGYKDVDFDDIIINAGKSVEQSELNQILPFDTNNAAIFDESFLAGFKAEHYSKNLKNGFIDAKNQMKPIIKRKILNGYIYDVVDYMNITTNYDNVKYKYAMLPIWFGIFKHQNKSYRFLVNGENGKVTGKYPISILRVAIFILIIAVIFIGMLFLVSQYG